LNVSFQSTARSSDDLHQPGCKQQCDEHLARQRDIELPQRESWQEEDEYIRSHVESTLAQDDIVHIIALATRRELVPDHPPGPTVKHRPEGEEGIDDEGCCNRSPRPIPHEFITAA
jgi:hypothetical protein